jgi:type II secretory pathway pseudopilin PulG
MQRPLAPTASKSCHWIPRRRQRGFSVVAGVVLVAILLVLAAIAIPNLLHSNLSENESSVLNALRALNAACANYSMLYGGYPKSLSNLGPGDSTGFASAGLVDASVASGTKTGYSFTYTPGATGVSGNVLSYSITANPLRPSAASERRFFTDQSGVIRANTTGAADGSSTPIG